MYLVQGNHLTDVRCRSITSKILRYTNPTLASNVEHLYQNEHLKSEDFLSLFPGRCHPSLDGTDTYLKEWEPPAHLTTLLVQCLIARLSLACSSGALCFLSLLS